MLKKYFILIFLFLISYVGFSNLRNFGNDKIIRKYLIDHNIDNFETLYLIEKDLWPSSYYFYNVFGRDIKVCIIESFGNLLSRKYNKVLLENYQLNPSSDNQPKINLDVILQKELKETCQFISKVNNNSFSSILVLSKINLKQIPFENYKIIDQIDFPLRYGANSKLKNLSLLNLKRYDVIKLNENY